MKKENQRRVLDLLCAASYKVEVLDGRVWLRGPDGELLSQRDKDKYGTIKQSLSYAAFSGIYQDRFGIRLHHASYFHGRLLSLNKSFSDITQQEKEGVMYAPDLIIHHRDTVADNNHWSNLEVMTRADSHTARSIGLKERHPTTEQTALIAALLQGFPSIRRKALSRVLGVSLDAFPLNPKENV